MRCILGNPALAAACALTVLYAAPRAMGADEATKADVKPLSSAWAATAPTSRVAASGPASSLPAIAPTSRVVGSGPAASLPAAAPTSRVAGSGPASSRPAAANQPPSRPAVDWLNLSPDQLPSSPLGGAASRGAANPSGLVTNLFYNTPLRDALSDIATQTGVVIIPDSTVEGIVSAELKDVALEEALGMVLSVGNFVWQREEGYIFVGSGDPESPSFPRVCETRTIKLDYVKADVAQQLLSPAFRKYVQAVKDQKLVTATAPPELLDKIEAELRALDKTPRQIMLDARFIVMENQDLQDLGMTWNWPTLSAGTFTTSDYHGGGALAAPGANWPWAIQVGYTPNKEFSNSLIMHLNLLTENNQATVLASPQVLAVEGVESQISVQNEEYFQILTQGFYQQAQLEKVQSGTLLKITPAIAADGEITMSLAAEVSDVVARGADNLPVVTRRTATSTVRVLDGGTAAVGGLLDNRTRDTRQAVPGLHAIPLLGRFFTNRSDSDLSRQVAVFITPRLIAERTEPISHDQGQGPRAAVAPVDRAEFTKALAGLLARQKNGTLE
ncbi:MAG: hypothetical protein NTW86_13005 [Candidatus Sumerlaeota bacterium]|nr:hypothetical protein [Candidatus Sumerlaeota bacterium]